MRREIAGETVLREIWIPPGPIFSMNDAGCEQTFSSAASSVSIVNTMPPGSAVSFERARDTAPRSEEHTSELQSQSNLVCRLLLEKKKNAKILALLEGMPASGSPEKNSTMIRSSSDS